MKQNTKTYYFRINQLMVIIFLVIITSPKIYSQAQEQRLLAEGRTNLCTPHTNKPVDSPSTLSWANLSAPTDSVVHHSEMGALQKFTSVKNEEIYIKVDAVVLIKENSLRSEFVIKPGAEMHHIMLTYNRARNIEVNNEKELVHDGEFRRYAMTEPIVYQLVGGDNKLISTEYEIDIDGIVNFNIDEFDKSQPIFIIPSTYNISDFAEYNFQNYYYNTRVELARIE